MRYTDVTIVLPTYNEGKNIGRLIARITGDYPGIRVIVADDGSKDGTLDEARRAAKRNGNVSFFDRSKRGLEKGLTGSAVDGILKSRTKFAIVMDADFQHPPEKIGSIIEALRNGNRLVVAVREAVPGWEAHRKAISKLLIVVGYVVLVIRGKARCSDIFSGYFGVERKFFSDTYKNNKSRFVGNGYKILFDLLKCIDGTYRVEEVPFTFNVRAAGKSKASATHVAALVKSFFS